MKSECKFPELYLFREKVIQLHPIIISAFSFPGESKCDKHQTNLSKWLNKKYENIGSLYEESEPLLLLLLSLGSDLGLEGI